jgi:hypothetical protein
MFLAQLSDISTRDVLPGAGPGLAPTSFQQEL